MEALLFIGLLGGVWYVLHRMSGNLKKKMIGFFVELTKGVGLEPDLSNPKSPKASGEYRGRGSFLKSTPAMRTVIRDHWESERLEP